MLVMAPIGVMCLFMAACSEPKPAPDASAPKEPTRSVTMTSGVIHFDGVPEEGITLKEVIIVSKLDSEAQERLERQRQLFEYKITGNNPEQRLASVYGADLSLEDTTQLVASIEELKQLKLEQITIETKRYQLRRYYSAMLALCVTLVMKN